MAAVLAADTNLWNDIRAIIPDLPHDTDYPYPIRILAAFKVVRPYSILIRILNKFMETLFFDHIMYASQNYNTME